MTDAQLIETVASSVARATLAAGGALMPPKTPTTPKPVRTHPVRPKPPRREPVDRDRRAVAIHEAGHAGAGVALGAELRLAVLAPEGTTLRGGRAGQTNFSCKATYHDPEVAYAGPWARAKFQAGGRRPTLQEFLLLPRRHRSRDRQVLTAAGGTHEGAGVHVLLVILADSVELARVPLLARRAHRGEAQAR